jgi:hypothetical protein
MASDYLRMTADTLATLPLEKQEEVYDFARFLKANTTHTATIEKKRKGSVLNIIGIGKSGVGDLALNHDKYLSSGPVALGLFAA